MRRLRRATLLLLLLAPCVAAGEPAGRFEAGFASGEGIRVAVLADADTRIAIVSLDLPAVPAHIRESVVSRTDRPYFDAMVVTATGREVGLHGLTDLPFRRETSGPFEVDRLRAVVESVVGLLRTADVARAPASAGTMTTRPEDPNSPRLSVFKALGPDFTPRGLIVHCDGTPDLVAEVEKATGAIVLFLGGALGPPPGDAKWLLSAAIDLASNGEISPAAPVTLRGTAQVPAFTWAGPLLGRKGESALAPSAVDLPVTRFSIGGIDVVTAPGDVTPEVARALGADEDTWVVSRAQADFGTFLDRTRFRSDEGTEQAFFGPEAVDDLAAAAKGQTPNRTPTPWAYVVDPAHLRAKDGTSRGLGRAHGDLLGAEIRELLAAAETRFKSDVLSKGGGLLLAPEVAETGLPAGDLVGRAMVRQARRLQRFVPPDLLDEMEGVAEGARVPYDAILLENTFLTLAEQPDKAALLRMPARCTNVVAMGDATSMGQLIHASTLDWGMKEVLKDRTRVLVFEPPTGHPFVSVTWPGMVGTLRAMGAQGIAVTEESCEAIGDSGMEGIPLNLLLRDVVQRSESLDDAVKRLREAPGTCGYKVTVSDGHRLDARVVEMTARHSQVRAPQQGLLFGCDPDSPCVGGACDPAIPRNDASSAKRYPAIRALLESGRKRLRTALVSSALATTSGGVLNDGTLLACVFEPQDGVFHVALGDDVDPEEGTLSWESHSLPDLLSPEARARYVEPAPVLATGPVEERARIGSMFGLSIRDVTFRSPRPSGHPWNDEVRGELFLPEDAIGCVILLPPWKERTMAADRLLAVALAKEKIAAFLLPLPYQGDRTPPGKRSGEWTLSNDLARTREALFQGTAETALVSRWLEEAHGFAPARQGILGTSLGGHVAAIAAGAYPERFRAGAFLLAGSHVHRTFLEPNGTTDRIRDALIARGVTADEAIPFLKGLDPGTYGRPEGKDRVLLIACREDPVVPPGNVEALAKAWGGARIVWFPGDHYGILTHLGEVYRALTEHFRDRFSHP